MSKSVRGNQRSSLSVTMSDFAPKKPTKSDHHTVRDQENKAADIIGGKRHAFSGAKVGLKSDCSSREYQLEAKQTESDSISIKLSWLKKISEEAAGKSKTPLLHIRFLCAHVGVEQDWMLVPGREFKKLVDGE